MTTGSEAFLPLLDLAIEPKSEADRGKLHAALTELAVADPSFHVVTDPESGRTILSGTSEAHLDEKIEKLERVHAVDIKIGALRVAYRETLTKSVLKDYTYKKSIDGVRQHAHATLMFEPNRLGASFEVRMVDDTLPAAFVAGLETGIKDIMRSGVLAGFPLLDVKVILVDGTYHHVDSSALAFEILARAAFREVLREGGSVLMEPVMKVEVTAPEAYAGFLTADIRARRGQVERREVRGAIVVIDALVPFANMLGYASPLRSGTEGQRTFKMNFAHYQAVEDQGGGKPPPSVAVALRA